MKYLVLAVFTGLVISPVTRAADISGDMYFRGTITAISGDASANVHVGDPFEYRWTFQFTEWDAVWARLHSFPYLDSSQFQGIPDAGCTLGNNCYFTGAFYGDEAGQTASFNVLSRYVIQPFEIDSFYSGDGIQLFLENGKITGAVEMGAINNDPFGVLYVSYGQGAPGYFDFFYPDEPSEVEYYGPITSFSYSPEPSTLPIIGGILILSFLIFKRADSGRAFPPA